MTDAQNNTVTHEQAIAIICGEAEELGYCEEDIAEFRQGKFDGDDLLILQSVERALSPTPAPSDQAGWQLVPIELTQAMLDATCATEMDDDDMRRTWADLLRTAPTLTAGEGGGDE